MSCSSNREDWAKALLGSTMPIGYVDPEPPPLPVEVPGGLGYADLTGLHGWRVNVMITDDPGDDRYGPSMLEPAFVAWWNREQALKQGTRFLVRMRDPFMTPPLHWYERGLAGRALRFCVRLGLRPILQRTIRVMRYMIGFSSDPEASAPSS